MLTAAITGMFLLANTALISYLRGRQRPRNP